MRFTIEERHLIKWMRVSKIAQDAFWQKMKSWWVKDTDQKISARSLYFGWQ